MISRWVRLACCALALAAFATDGIDGASDVPNLDNH